MSEKYSPDWLRGYGDGKAAGRRFRNEFGPVRQPARNDRDELSESLSRLAVGSVSDDARLQQIEEVRKLAVRSRHNDWSGLALAATALLAGSYDDAPAATWLPVMLAERGDFEAAAAHRADGGVGAPGWARTILVTALSELGRRDEARELMASLSSRYDGVRSGFVGRWDEGKVAVEYARLTETTAVRERALPTFYHLPFSGGTSMIVSLKRVVPWGRMVQVQRRFGLLQVEQALQLGPDEVRDRMMVHQHHPLPLELPGRDLSYFTVLRDPVSQMRSGFYKRMSTRGIVPTGDHRVSEDFGDHVEYTISHGLTNMLSRQLVMTHPAMRSAYEAEFSSAGAFRPITSEEDMFWFRATADLSASRLDEMVHEVLEDRFHLVGSMRHLGASHLAASASIGLPVAQRVGHRGKSGQPTTDQGTDPVEERLRDANAVDQRIFEEYTVRFERTYAPLISALDAEAADENASNAG